MIGNIVLSSFLVCVFMLKNLIVIVVMLACRILAAIDLSSGDDVCRKLRTAISRKTYAITFQKLAKQAIQEDDETRITLNDSLTTNFEEMQATLTSSKLIILHTIETEEKAIQALQYYTQALSQIDMFISLLEKQWAKLLEEDYS